MDYIRRVFLFDCIFVRFAYHLRVHGLLRLHLARPEPLLSQGLNINKAMITGTMITFRKWQLPFFISPFFKCSIKVSFISCVHWSVIPFSLYLQINKIFNVTHLQPFLPEKSFKIIQFFWKMTNDHNNDRKLLMDSMAQWYPSQVMGSICFINESCCPSDRTDRWYVFFSHMTFCDKVMNVPFKSNHEIFKGLSVKHLWNNFLNFPSLTNHQCNFKKYYTSTLPSFFLFFMHWK